MARTRTTITGAFDTPEVYQYHSSPSGAVTTYTSYSGTQHTKQIVDVQTPNYHSVKKCGKFLPLNPVTILDKTEQRIPGPVTTARLTPPLHYYTGTYAGWVSDPLLGEPEVDQALLDSVTLSACQKAAESDFDALTFIGEFKGTVMTLAQAYRVFNARTASLARLARRKARTPQEAWLFFKDLWLSHRYGVRPLLFDVRDAIAALNRLGSGESFVEGRGYTQVNCGATAHSVLSYNAGKYDVVCTRVGTVEYRGVAYVDRGADWHAAFGADPLSTALELVPYSFVLDWLINIGGWVRTLPRTLQGDFLGIGNSLKFNYKIEQKWTGFGPSSGGWDGLNGPYICTLDIKKYVRSPASVPLPPLIPELTLPRVVDLVALALSGRRRVYAILGSN